MGRLLSLLALVVAMAIGLWLFSQKASKDVQRVTTWQVEGEKSAQPASLDWREAQESLARLDSLLAASEPAPRELSAIAQKAAQWVAGSRPGSPEYRLAVALRAACLALAQAGPDASDPQRQKARSELAVARSVLAGESPGSVTHGIQDQLKNLQVEHGEQVQKALEETAP
ncbi:hypothetical protein HRbin09_00885 [bacterium HR09]|nr:hypothetical protein HRbin09_00885 [bacterium HR09]